MYWSFNCSAVEGAFEFGLSDSAAVPVEVVFAEFDLGSFV
jgi:hypothetical protein